MTSRHLFFRAMREDLRHKVWMAALSILGNFLALPVGWMIWRSNMMDYWGGVAGLMQQDARHIVEFQDGVLGYFGGYLVMAGGIIAFAGALITGLFSFRYLFHRNMVDTWHSLPVKRDTLYGVNYLNGILIWFVPFLVSLLWMLFMGGSLMRQIGGAGRIPELIVGAAFGLLVLAVLYLLVYNVALAAVMLSGNVLNTLVALGILGFGVMALYALGITYFEVYMGTFYSSALDLDPVMYGSPLFSALAMLTVQADGGSMQEVHKALFINTGVAVGLGIAAWMLYRRRASEAAEQGSCNRVMATVFRVIAGVAAGMCGWGFFVLLVSDSRALGWGMFGAILAGVCTFGVLDIIFQMDFKAFFSHKLQMALAVALSLLVCFAFLWDWFGYDTRLPKKEDIAEIAILDRELANRYYYFSSPFEEMHYQDRERAYAFLERMTEHEREETDADMETERINVKVTLNNGTSYYRNYWMRKEDKELLWPIVTDEEYLKHAYLISDGDLEACTSFCIAMGGEEYYKDEVTEELRDIVEAYNQDVLEDPDRVLLGESRTVGEVILRVWHEGENGTGFRTEICMDVYEGMERTVKALRRAGFEAPDAEALGVQKVILKLECGRDASAQERVAAARAYYGVSWQAEKGGIQGAERGSTDERVYDPAGDSNSMESSDIQGEMTLAEEKTGAMGYVPATESTACIYVEVDAPEEIRELFGLLRYGGSYLSDSIFGEECITVTLVVADGNTQTWFLPKGALPEKYILRFAETPHEGE